MICLNVLKFILVDFFSLPKLIRRKYRLDYKTLLSFTVSFFFYMNVLSHSFWGVNLQYALVYFDSQKYLGLMPWLTRWGCNRQACLCVSAALCVYRHHILSEKCLVWMKLPASLHLVTLWSGNSSFLITGTLIHLSVHLSSIQL